MSEKYKIAIIGLGYVGLPLARLFAAQYPVVGYDINQKRIKELQDGHDSTLEVEDTDLQAVLLNRNPFPFHSPADTEQSRSESIATGLFCTNHLIDVQNANVYIITVPTPVDKHHRPDLDPLYMSSQSVGSILKKGDVVIYESTVYPGVTEEECVPVLERESGLIFNQDFFVGYSPERNNPNHPYSIENKTQVNRRQLAIEVVNQQNQN